MTQATARIREDVARATVAFLTQGNSPHAPPFAGLISRSVFESPTNSRWSSGFGHHLIAWKNVTPEEVVGDLLQLREKTGETMRLYDRSLGYVLQCWDNMMLGLEEPPLP